MTDDAIDELVARSTAHRELSIFAAFHRAHPEVLDFLVTEIRLRIAKGFPAFSFASLWHYCRWKLEIETGPSTTYAMNDHLVPFYARAIFILHPDLNGRAELRSALADKLFGTERTPRAEAMAGDYAVRLRWADGRDLECGWRPTRPHVPVFGGGRRANIHEGSGA